MLVGARNWAGSKKYSNRRAAEAQPEGEPLDDIDSWDRLSRGDDPTNPQRA
ncbi:MAG: Trp biosynthesis-associated membrane protein [Renibacterium salmoninarum]|nr:Trp biosynthesis-associated membrane protein [Renibacterium salmoninarum]